VRAGVALVERSDDATALVAALAPDRFLADEPTLLDRARDWMPRIPFGEIDLLLIDRIGKNISGAGMDLNVVGRKSSMHHPHPADAVRARMIAVRGLTSETHGNAIGVGLAELCRSRVLDQMDREATRLNALTSGDLAGAMAPLDYATDAEMIDVAMGQIGLRSRADARIVWIANTLHLGVLWASAPAVAEANDLDQVGPAVELRFDASGNLPDDLGSDGLSR
jgi:hypothetical protein